MRNKCAVVALYLPQFHEIPENNEWWGKGFTEWTNVKKAVPLFKNHIQPRVPLNENYYDLSDSKVLIQHMKLAKEFGIDGFCFYHYWFGGKKLLEKPVENLLHEKKIPLDFMLCWANEPWTRTWDGDNGSKTILLDQNYGNKSDWEQHFLYLLDFFKREEYIKIDGRPVIAIYRATDIIDRKEMLSYWNQLAKEYGFKDGLFILNTHRSYVTQEYPVIGDGIYDFEPFISMQLYNESDRKTYLSVDETKRFPVYDYCKICERMINRYVFKETNHFLGFFTGWDNSPRVGERVKTIFENNTPQNVEHFFKIQYNRSVDLNNAMLFINAWNEWGEGAILEPDNLYGYGYLEAIKKGKGK